MNQTFQYLYVIAFIALISSIGGLTLIKFKTVSAEEFSKSELRKPASIPSWEWDKESIKNYFPKVNEYINDNFSLRSQLIQFYSRINLKIGVSTKPNKVLIGKNGFLFLGNYWTNVVEQVKGKSIFNNTELNNWLLQFNNRKNYLDRKDIELFVLVAPNKHSIYSEFLPSYIKKSNENRLNQICFSNRVFNLINPTQEILNAKAKFGDYLYPKTDSHWSEIGAYIAYLELMKEVQSQYKAVKPINLSEVNFKIEPFGGWDQDKMLNAKTEANDFIVKILSNQEWENNLIKTNYNGDTLSIDSMQPIRYNEQSIVYNDSKPYTVLVLKDSFSERLSIFLNQTFGKIIYCHYNQPEGIELTRLVDEYNPDMVIYEFVERAIPDLKPFCDSSLYNVNSSKSILKFDGINLFNNIIQNRQISNLKINDSCLSFTSENSDPSFIIPIKELPIEKLLMRIKG